MRKIDLSRSPVWSRLNRVLSGGIRQRVTRLGLAYSFVIVLVGVAAFVSANNLMFLLLALTIANFLISGFVSRLGLIGLSLEFKLPEHLSAGRKFPGRVRLRNTKNWMPSFSIHLSGTDPRIFQSIVYFPVVPRLSVLEETIVTQFPRRGSYSENAFVLSTRFPFGFTERRISVPLHGEIIVYPSIEPRPEFANLLMSLAGDMEARMRGRGADFYRIRPYEHGESARHVDWKATAHTGRLQVREFAREEDPSVEIVLDLTRRESDKEGEFEAWFEDAVDCCAFITWNLAQRGARLRFRTQAIDLRVPEETDAYAILKYLALVEPLGVARKNNGFSPDDTSDLQVVFSAEPGRLEGLGWHPDHWFRERMAADAANRPKA